MTTPTFDDLLVNPDNNPPPLQVEPTANAGETDPPPPQVEPTDGPPPLPHNDQKTNKCSQPLVKESTGYGTAGEELVEPILPNFEQLLEEEEVEDPPPDPPGQPCVNRPDPLLYSLGLAKTCSDRQCPNIQCWMGRQRLLSLWEGIQNASSHISHTWDPLALNGVRTIIQHAIECSDLEHCCRVPLCPILNARFPGEALNLAEKVGFLFWQYGSYTNRLIEPNSPVSNVVRFEMPRYNIGLIEGHDFRIVGCQEILGDCFVAETLKGNFYRFHIRQSAKPYIHVLERAFFGDGPPLATVPYLWYMEQEGLTYAATLTYGQPLTPILARSIGFDSCCRQFAEIASRLQQRGLVMIDWSGDKFAISNGLIVLTTLSGCVLLEDLEDECDIQVAALSSPPWMVPPEMWAGFYNIQHSTIFGMGVLLYYLDMNRYPVDIHTIQEEIRCMMREGNYSFNLADTSSAEVRRVLTWMLQKDPLRRPTPSDLCARYQLPMPLLL